MRRIIVLALLVGCSADGAGDDDQAPPKGQDDEGGDSKGREECDLATIESKCPRGWAFRYDDSPPSDELVYVELEDVGESVCNGRGVYATPEALQDAPAPAGVTVARNSECSITCYPQCSFTSVCYAENPDGRACGYGCSPDGLTRDECVEFVAECLGEDAAACGS